MRFRVSTALALGFLAGSSPARAQVLPAPEPLAIVGGYPARDVAAFAQVRTTFRGGRVIWEAGTD
jgi:hypothetical protein